MIARLIASLHRPRSSRTYFSEVDGLRFLAIAIVIISHIYLAWSRQPGFESAHAATEKSWPEWFVFFLHRGDMGVLIFFVLSAYIISLPFVDAARTGARMSLRNYYLRRLVRIEPPYLIITTGIFLLYAVTGIAHIRYYTPHYLASMGYLHNIIFPHVYGLNDVAWSLEIEIQFYIIAPLLFKIFRLPRLPRRLLLIALAALAFTIPYFWKLPILCLYQFAGYFLAGMLIADLMQDARRLSQSWLGIISIAGVIAIVNVFFGVFFKAPYQHWVMQQSVAVLVFAGLCPTPLRSVLRLRVLALIGGMCYSIYLVHNLLFVFLFKWGLVFNDNAQPTMAFLANELYLFIISIIIGAVVYKIAEQPFMKQSARYPLFDKEAS